VLYKEISAVCSETHKKQKKYTVRVERGIVEVYTGDIYNDHWTVEG
jgi:hypothetical protein